MTMIPASWNTTRLSIACATMEDAPRLQEIFRACSYVAQWDESFQEQPVSAITDLIEKSVAATGGGPELFRMQAVRVGESDEIIGYFHLYHGMPKPEVAYLSMLVIDPAYQKLAYGGELTAGLSDQVRTAGYPLFWLRVYLKNWPALRHWMNNGFTTMKEWRGDTVHSDTTHAGLILEKIL
ncbi:MAG: family N-acetyltransferase [Chlorobi bacterium]|nr:family N-acetyltransferase [Chlorobiota bacterium]